MSEDLDLAIPLRPEDLLQAQGTYCVEEIDIEEALSKLDSESSPSEILSARMSMSDALWGMCCIDLHIDE